MGLNGSVFKDFLEFFVFLSVFGEGYGFYLYCCCKRKEVLVGVVIGRRFVLYN